MAKSTAVTGMKWPKLWAAVVCGLGGLAARPGPAFANSEKLLQSLLSRQNVFKLISESEDSDSDLKPGIYALATKGSPVRPLVLGNIPDVGESFNGLLAQFEMTQRTRREEALTVVDGKLVLFSNRSTPQSAKSIISFSGNTPVLDGVMLRPFLLEPIKSIDDVRVQLSSDTEDDRAELLIVSVRQPNPMGTGVTFAAILEPESDKSKSSELKLRTAPLIIDYDFLGADELERLRTACRTSDCVLSRSHLMSLSQPSPQDDRILRQWREVLAKVGNEIKLNARTRDTMIKRISPTVGGSRLNPPKLNLSRGNFELNQLPNQVLLSNPFRIIQRVDPRGTHSGVFIKSSSSVLTLDSVTDELKPEIPGQIDYESRTGKYRIANLLTFGRGKEANIYDSLGAASPSSLVMTGVNGKPWILMKSEDPGESVAVVGLTDTFPFQNCAKLAGLHQWTRGEAQSPGHIVLISYECNRRDRGTVAFLIERAGDRNVQTASLKISGDFMDPVELRTRFWNRGSDFLFDNVSENARSQEEIATQPKNHEAETSGETNQNILTSPFLDLAASLRAGRKEQVYLTHQKSTAVDAGLSYLEYNPRGTQTPWTGFYVRYEAAWPPKLKSERNSDYTQNIDGYLLEKTEEGNPGAAEQVILKQSLKKDGVTYGRLTLIPSSQTDPKTRNTNIFNLITYMRDEGDSTSDAVPFLGTIPVRADFKAFSGGQIIQGRRDMQNEASLLIFINGGAAPGVYALPLRFFRRNEHGLAQWVVEPGEWSWIHHGDFNPATLKSRIAFDNLGSPFWLETPDMDRFEAKYGVRSIAKNPNHLYFVNRPGFRSVLRYDETIDQGEGTYFNGLNRWLVTFTQDLTSKYKGLTEFLTDLRKTSRKKRPPEPLFPELANYLENLATLNVERNQQVVLLEKELKENVVKDVLARFIDSKTPLWNVDNLSFGFHDFDPASSPESMLRELDKLGRKADRKDVLFIDMKRVQDADQLDPPISMRHVANDEMDTVDETGTNVTAKSKAVGGEESEEEEDTGGDDLKRDTERFIARHDSEGKEEGKTYDEDKVKFDFSRMTYVATQGAPPRLENFGSINPGTRFQTVIFATPEEWRNQIESFPKEARAGVFNKFQVNSRFLTGSWTLWAPNSSRASERTKRLAREPVSKDEFSIFKELDRTLTELADVKGPKRQRILVVPEEIKAYINSLILTRWATNAREMAGPWSYRNPDLSLFEVNAEEGLTQEKIADNFESMRGAAVSRRAVLFADMAEILKIGRPMGKNEDRTFRLRDPILSGQNNSSLIEKSTAEGAEASEELDRRAVPHGIWWIASEGRTVQPKKERGWSLKEEAPPDIPTLIIATEKEMESLNQATNFESRFFDVKKHFEVSRLEKPSPEAKIKLVEDLFDRPDISSLGFQFSHESLGNDEARRQLIGLFVGRVDQIARNQRIEPTDAFTRTFVALKRALTEDSDLRRTRKIDRFYLERLYTRVFPLALNFEVLESHDFLHRFRDPNRAARGLTDAGYEGALELKERNARNIAAQTKGVSDNGMKVPSSQIFFGDTSTGKTFLVESTINFAGLKRYDYDRPQDEEAQAMVVSVQQIAESKEKAKAGQISVDEVLEHLSNFIALPKGSRGLILFDDLHKTQSKIVWQKLKTFIESLFEAKDGLITVKRLGEKYSPIKAPVRNLILYATINPQDDEQIRRKYVKNEADIVGEVMAALNKPDYDPIDRSHFARWTDIIDLRKFPRDAKVPTLLKQLREANAQSFAAKPNLVLVTSRTMDEISYGFEDANAREFLSPATYALLEAPYHLPKAPIYLIDRQRTDMAGADEESKPVRRLQSGEVEAFVKERTVQYAITDKNPTSKIRLLSYMLDNFRTQIYSQLVLAGQSAPGLSETEELRKSEMVSFLFAMMSNIVDFPSVPVKDVILRPDDFKLYDLEAIASFEDDVHRLSEKTARPFFRVELQGESDSTEMSLDSFLSGRTDTRMGQRRTDIMIHTAAEIEALLTPTFAHYFRLPDLRLTQTPREWLMNLPDEESRESSKEVARRLVEIYEHFQAHLYDADLEEMRNPGDYQVMNIYDRSRLFLLCLDRAMTRLPWGHMTQFMVSALELASTDLTLSQRTEFQDFLFKSKFSPFNTITPDTVVSLAQAVNLVKNAPGEQHASLSRNFNANCERFLSLPAQPEERP